MEIVAQIVGETVVVAQAAEAVAEDVDAAVPGEAAVVASAAVDTAEAVTKREMEDWRPARPSPSERSAVLKGRDKHRGLFFFHDTRRAGCPPSRAQLAYSGQRPERVSSRHGQKRNRIPKADAEIPDLDQRIHASAVPVARCAPISYGEFSENNDQASGIRIASQSVL